LATLLVLGTIQVLSAQQQGESVRKGAVLRSLVLPGWGQHTLGADRWARRFVTAEAGLWLSMAAANKWAAVNRDDYRSYAAQYAGVINRSRPDIYYFRLGAWDNMGEYNQDQLRRRNIAAVYTTGSDADWDWEGATHRQRYRELRHSSLRWDQTATIALSGLVVNRVLAAINILFLTRTMPEAAVLPLPGAAGGLLRLNWEF
jgi:hypothetical protein